MAAELRITAGREVPATAREKVQIELRKFDREIAPQIMRAMTSALSEQQSGHQRFTIIYRNGVIVGLGLSCDFKVALDGQVEE